METKITREQVLETMANANQVEGFDPRLVTTCYKDADGNARMYLQAEPAMMWFRLKHSGGRLEQIVYRANDMMATVEGRVIDENGNLLANAFATRYHADDQFGKDYIQNAGTAAIRKALGNCGFGTPANAEYIEGVTVCHEAAELTDAPVDDGVEAKIPVPPIPKEVVEAEKKTATRTRKTAKSRNSRKKLHRLKPIHRLNLNRSPNRSLNQHIRRFRFRLFPVSRKLRKSLKRWKKP